MVLIIKNILHKYNVKYDEMFMNAAKTRHYQFNDYFTNNYKLEHQIPYELYKNKRMDRQFR